jgi:cytochrome c biogenesis protein
MTLLRSLASLRLTLVGMLLLAVGAGLTYDNRLDLPVWVLAVPLGVLAVNLSAAILTNERINRQFWLLVFHVGLLGIVVLAAIGRLAYFDAHIELAEGQEFTPDALLEVKKGPLHGGKLDHVHFVQGPYTVQYAAGMQRGLTHSQVAVAAPEGGLTTRVIGDDRPLVLEGYRFYTTFNKGFSVILTWVPNAGPPMTGRVNLPSYPLYDYKQDNTWTPQDGPPIKFWLQLETGLREDAAWTLDARNSRGVLVVTQKDRRVELNPGDTAEIEGGALRYERLTSWMGYKVYYDPTLRWLFFVSVLAVIGLGMHYWRVMGSRLWPAVLQDARDTAESQTRGKS